MRGIEIVVFVLLIEGSLGFVKSLKLWVSGFLMMMIDKIWEKMEVKVLIIKVIIFWLELLLVLGIGFLELL